MVDTSSLLSAKRQIDELTNGRTPVSFRYNGIPFPEGFNKNGINSNINKSTGLLVESEFVKYPGNSAIEWTVYLENTGNEDTMIIDDLLPLDFTIDYDNKAMIGYSNGATGKIDAFSYNEDELVNQREFNSESSREYVPFFNLDCGGYGVIIGIGWTGHWRLFLEKQTDSIRITTGMPQTHFILHPGERVRTPRILLMFWERDKILAHNMLRRHLSANHIPCGPDGEPNPPMCCPSWGGMKSKNHIEYIKFLKEHKMMFDCYWIDAGWYGPDHETDEFQNFNNEDWPYYCGDWRVNRTVYPDGIKSVSDAAHKAGMKLLLWFSSFQCIAGTGWHKEHPEWGKLFEPAIVCCNPKLAQFAIINLAIPEAQKWITDKICSLMQENNVDYYREDTYMPYGGEDDTDRIGIGEMKGVEAFYHFWDELHNRIPGLLIDNCGGGGSRVDLETISRSYVLWRSDYNCDPEADPIGSQVGNYGLGHWIPLVNGCPPIKSGSNYSFRSGLYGGMAFGLFHPAGFGNAPISPALDYPVEWHVECLRQYQLIKPLLSGDFYPITQSTTKSDEWMAYRFERADLGRGVIFGFRRQDCLFTELSISINLEPGIYLFTDMDDWEETKHTTTNELLLTLKIDSKPGSCAIMYKKLLT